MRLHSLKQSNMNNNHPSLYGRVIQDLEQIFITNELSDFLAKDMINMK